MKALHSQQEGLDEGMETGSTPPSLPTTTAASMAVLHWAEGMAGRKVSKKKKSNVNLADKSRGSSVPWGQTGGGAAVEWDTEKGKVWSGINPQ